MFHVVTGAQESMLSPAQLQWGGQVCPKAAGIVEEMESTEWIRYVNLANKNRFGIRGVFGTTRLLEQNSASCAEDLAIDQTIQGCRLLAEMGWIGEVRSHPNET